MSKYFLLAAVLILAACSSDDDDVDTTKPVIEVIKPAAEEGEEHIHFHQGDTFDFEAKFTDNVALKSYKVNIHFGEGHEHSVVMKSATEDDHDHIEWEYDADGDLEGTEDRAVISGIEIPENAEPGEYHLGVYCFDVAGNESIVWMELEVEEEGHEH